MNVPNRVVSDPAVYAGEPCIRGTRIPVRVILSHLAAGETEAEILRQFPRVVSLDIKACLEYAAFLASERAA